MIILLFHLKKRLINAPNLLIVFKYIILKNLNAMNHFFSISCFHELPTNETFL